MAIAIFGCVDACGEPVASLTSLPLSLQQLEKFVLRPAGRQRSARPPNISMFPRQLPSVSTSPSAGAPGSSTTGSSSIGFAAVSMQAFGEQLGTPPLASVRSEEHTSELQSLMRISYAVFCLKKKKTHR